ncbi:PA1571 family protein [Pseudomonas huanghezhanensis]|uniref:PA1571 family protein n=1 Tax=Pseudomonas huanghezhanensis TaxID=3002903 RepID=UPI00228673BB|nr:PA1571 family protein [Pseudomonas sp. BSw22131]
MSLHESSNHTAAVQANPNLNVGGAILDKNGKEVLITEEMVQKACLECEKYWVKPEKQD